MDLPVNTIICGDAKTELAKLPAESINCCVSSPPYFALRDYGVEGQLGLEPTFEEYIKHLCDVYDEVKRVLRKDGTCFVNLGDTYSQGDNPSNRTGLSTSQIKPKGNVNFNINVKQSIQQKSLCCIPDRFRIEMINRGWILRNVIIWYKPNPMPSSAKDRFTVDFEPVMFFVKSNTSTYWVHPRKMRTKGTRPKADYIWTHKNTSLEVDYQPFSDRLCKGKKRLWDRRNLWEGRDYWFEPQYEPHSRDWTNSGGSFAHPVPTSEHGKTGYAHSGPYPTPNPLGRNKRTVWTIPTQAYSEAHFATFPEKLVEPMIKSGCPEFVCKKCGKARKKVWETTFLQTGGNRNNITGQNNMEGWEGVPRGNQEHHFKGYTDCGCGAEWRSGICLDPFRRFGNGRLGSRPVAA